MATTKTIQPTGTTITIPAMTDKPNASVYSTDVGRITDAVNALDSKFAFSVGMIRAAAGADADALYPDNQRVGFYAASYQVANLPTQDWYFLISFRGETTYITQIAFGMTGTGVYWRKFNTSTTGATWSQIA